MAEQPRQFFVRALFHSLAEQFLYFGNCGIGRQSWIEHAPDAALASTLPAIAPAVIRAFDDVFPARLVAVITVVIASEKIAELVEREFLWIAQADGDDFQFGSIGLGAKHRAGIGQRIYREAGPMIHDPV